MVQSKIRLERKFPVQCLITKKNDFSIISAKHYQDFHKEGYAFYLSDDYKTAESWMKTRCKTEELDYGAILIFEVPEATEDFWKG